MDIAVHIQIHFMILVAAAVQRVVVVELYTSFCGNRSSFNDDIGNVLRILRYTN